MEASLWYLNEIRLDGGGKIEDWPKYTGLPIGAPGLELGNATGASGSVVLCPGEGRHLVVEWAHTSRPGVSPEMPLGEFYEPPEGPVLAIELTATSGQLDEVERNIVFEELDELHYSVKAAFESVLTDDGIALMESRS